MDKQKCIIQCLADGDFHSGEAIASTLGISRAAVSKRVKQLSSLGLDVFSVSGKGHRLARPLELLESDKITAGLDRHIEALIKPLRIFDRLDSTNNYLSTMLLSESIHAVVILAEFQDKGKGRRGNEWLSPYASGICLSMGWHFESTPASYTALSLATGVAICRALEKSGISGVGLKWSNDLVVNRKKLGGILIESRTETAGHSDTIIGIGLNMDLSADLQARINQPITDLLELSDIKVSRNELSGRIINELGHLLSNYETQGFAACLNDWHRFDSLNGAQVKIDLGKEEIRGVVEGIDENGLLLLRSENELKRFSHGEVSVRVEA